MRKIIAVSFLLFPVLSFSQVNDLSILIKIGRASYNDAIGNLGGGGNSYDFWKPGPQFTIGLEKKLNSSFSAQGIITYSIHRYNGIQTFGETTNDASNRILEVMGNLKLNIGIFYSMLGVGISNQNGDEIRYLESNQYHSASAAIEAKNKTAVAGLFGLGFDIHIYDRISVLAEGDIFFREYLGSVWLLGVRYSINEL